MRQIDIADTRVPKLTGGARPSPDAASYIKNLRVLHEARGVRAIAGHANALARQCGGGGIENRPAESGDHVTRTREKRVSHCDYLTGSRGAGRKYGWRSQKRGK